MKALILAGGTGTRLWPLSREKKPKQFHTFIGDRTLLQQTAARLDFLKPEDIYISTGVLYATEIKRQLPRIPKDHIFVEPESRDTGPAIAFAAHQLFKKFPNEVMAVIYADHIIQNTVEFRKKLLVAETYAKKHHTLNIIEVKAHSPNPNLGYVKIGKLAEELSYGTEIYGLERFIEKPDIETAKKYVASYKYMWNTGIYVWEVKTILEKFRNYAPEIYECVTEKKNAYENCPKISIDYCIMEKISPQEVRIIPAELGWSDIGNWAGLFDELSSSEDMNFIQGEHIGLDTKGCVIYTNKSGKLIVTSDIHNMVIVDTEDALLVIPKEKASEVKRLVEELRKRKKEKYV